MQQLEVSTTNPVSGEVDPESKMQLNYYKSIDSQNKIYNKVLLIQNSHRSRLNFGKAAAGLYKTSYDPAEEAIEGEEEVNEDLAVEEDQVDVEAAVPKTTHINKKPVRGADGLFTINENQSDEESLDPQA